MSNSKTKSSKSGTEPFSRVTKLEQIPPALFEVLILAQAIKTPEGEKIAAITDSIISVSLADPEAWLKIRNVTKNDAAPTGRGCPAFLQFFCKLHKTQPIAVSNLRFLQIYKQILNTNAQLPALRKTFLH